MVEFLSIILFLGFLQFLLGFSKVPVFCVILYKVWTPRCPTYRRRYSVAPQWINKESNRQPRPETCHVSSQRDQVMLRCVDRVRRQLAHCHKTRYYNGKYSKLVNLENNNVYQESQNQIVHWRNVGYDFEIYSGPRVVLSNKDGNWK